MFGKSKTKTLTVVSKNNLKYKVEIVQRGNAFYYIKVFYNGEYINRGTHCAHSTHNVENGDFEKEIKRIINSYEPSILSKIKFEELKDNGTLKF